MGRKRYTIRDIAKMAKVSHTTVSRVLTGESRVREETRNRILKLVKTLEYRPDARARAFASKRSHLLGLLVSDISNPFYAELSRGIEDMALKQGYNVIFCSTDGKAGKTKAYANLMIDAGVDGLIFASVRLHEPVAEKLIHEGFPVVFINRKLKGSHYNYVVCDNIAGAYKITEHLINVGYKKIAIITGSSNLSTGIERLKGYQKALKDYNIDFNPTYVIQGPFIKKTGYEGAIKLLTVKDRPRAILSGNDYMAIGVIDAVEELGMNIPEDVAVAGFDDTDFASCLRTKLTTVSQRKYEMGNLGVQILIDYIERKEKNYIHQVILEPTLVIRESCGHKLRKNGKG